MLLACVGGGSNAIGLFHEFVDDADVRLIGKYKKAISQMCSTSTIQLLHQFIDNADVRLIGEHLSGHSLCCIMVCNVMFRCSKAIGM